MAELIKCANCGELFDSMKAFEIGCGRHKELWCPDCHKKGTRQADARTMIHMQQIKKNKNKRRQR